MLAEKPSRLGTLGPRLPLVVSKAAVEFDRAIQKRPIGFNSAKLLAEHLKEEFGSPVADSQELASFDAATVGIVGRALMPTQAPTTTIRDIVTRAWALVEKMETTNSASDEKSLEQCKRFCVEFGNNLIRHTESLDQFRPLNSYQR
jgi:hypothetical protein